MIRYCYGVKKAGKDEKWGLWLFPETVSDEIAIEEMIKKLGETQVVREGLR